MKSYFDLLKEVLNQRAIIDNRNIITIDDVGTSVIIAFNQACEYMRDFHNWKWNTREVTYINTDAQDSYPMPYGIVQTLTYVDDDNNKSILLYTDILTATEDKPSQWTQNWVDETIDIAPAVDFNLDTNSQMVIKYMDKNIAYNTTRVEANLIPRFDTTTDTTIQYLNVPELVYDSYARCVILKTRLLLNEGAQGTVFPAQTAEFNEAINSLMSYAKTPYYTSERTVI